MTVKQILSKHVTVCYIISAASYTSPSTCLTTFKI